MQASKLPNLLASLWHGIQDHQKRIVCFVCGMKWEIHHTYFPELGRKQGKLMKHVGEIVTKAENGQSCFVSYKLKNGTIVHEIRH